MRLVQDFTPYDDADAHIHSIVEWRFHRKKIVTPKYGRTNFAVNYCRSCNMFVWMWTLRYAPYAIENAFRWARVFVVLKFTFFCFRGSAFAGRRRCVMRCFFHVLHQLIKQIKNFDLFILASRASRSQFTYSVQCGKLQSLGGPGMTNVHALIVFIVIIWDLIKKLIILFYTYSRALLISYRRGRGIFSHQSIKLADEKKKEGKISNSLID